MKKYNNKYSRVVATVFLIFYSTFNVAINFHYHIININLLGNKSFDSSSHQANVTDPFKDNHNNCLLVRFINTKVIHERSNQFQEVEFEVSFIFNFSFEKTPTLDQNNLISPRAPPSFS